jgi:cell division protein FtsQ
MAKETSNIFIKDIEKRKRIRLAVIYSLAFIGAAGLFVLLGFVGKEQSSTACWKLEVQVEAPDGRKFIDEQMITALADSATDMIVGKAVSEVDIQAIHREISKNSSVSEAHVYTTVDGRCVIHVKQRSPIARIFNAYGESYYLDKDGFTMAISDLATVKLPVFTGEIYDGLGSESVAVDFPDTLAWRTYLDDIYAFTNIVAQDTFWRAQVEHVHINTGGEFEIIPRIGDQRVNVGGVVHLEEKLKKLKAFYEHAIHIADLDQYAIINAQYSGQVVCVKR